MKLWLAVFAAWTLLGVVNAAQYHLDGILSGDPTSWSRALARSVPWWMLWGALTPLVARVVARHPLDAERRGRDLAAHAAAALGIAVVHIVGYTVVTRVLLVTDPAMSEFTAALRGYIGKALLDVFTYAGIVAALVALSWQRRARDTELLASGLSARASALEAQLSQSQLEALRAQLHPHFLFNTLNAISVLALKGDGTAAARTISRLSELLRLTMDHAGDQEITLGAELGLLERYLDIERTRFGSRLAVSVHVPPECRPAFVPSFVLQPIVENALRHGVSKREEGGRIEISARRDNGSLVLEVRDDGPGLARSENGERVGVGLANTRARLARLYGEAARIDVENAEHGGASVTLVLPMRAEP